jgi:hypothetical protein
MTERRRLPNRRRSETFDFIAQGMKFTATFSRGDNGSVQEIFLTNHRASSQAGINASDAALVASIALQHSVPFDTIRKALSRDSQGRGSGPLAVAMDAIAEIESAP